MLITKASIQSLMAGFSGIYRTAYDNTPEFADKFVTTIPSSAKVETYGWMSRILKMRKWDGPRVIQNLNTAAYQLTNETYENTVGVDVDDIADDTLGVYNPIMSELGRTTRKWKDQLVKTVLQAGTSALSFDGVAFFASTHPLNPAGNQSNNFTTSALNATNYDTVRSAMRSYTGEDGEPLGVDPNLLIVPPQLEKAARDILQAEYLSSGASNVLKGTAELLVLPELANQSTTWYLADTRKGIMPLVFQLRQAPVITAMDQPTDEGVFNENQMRIGVKARGAAGYGLWWLMARSIA